MNDNFVEQIVECRATGKDTAIKVLMVVFSIISFIFLLIPYIGIFLTAAVIVATFFVFRNSNYEYEYSFVGGELDVDKIIARSRRKKVGSFDFNRVELVAPVDSQEAMRLEHNNYKVINVTSNKADAKVYAAFVMNNNEIVKLLFEPDEKMLGAISYIAPRKVIL
ncbi:MAG: DUF6106 family protein [Lachnospiraceae bacterium]